MTNHDALLAAICADPQDDTPRLVLADWWEENGQPERAEFCRVQVGLARLDPATLRDADLYLALGGTKAHSSPAGIRGLFPDPLGIDVDGIGMHWTKGVAFPTIDAIPARGFVAALTISWQDWLRHHERLYWHPTQTVECPDCAVGTEVNQQGRPRYVGWQWRKPPWNTAMLHGCATCGGSPGIGNESGIQGTGRIPRPFVPTAQPITAVRLMNVNVQPIPTMEGFTVHSPQLGGVRFDRVKCPACDGRGEVSSGEGIPYMMPCDQCGGNALNQWTCPAWPGVVFEMPQTA